MQTSRILFLFLVIGLMIHLSTPSSGIEKIGPEIERGQQGRQFALPWGVFSSGVVPWWNSGYDGKGIIVGVIWSGANGKHRDLIGSWVGNDGGWKDPYHQTTFPEDTDTGDSLGTHILGIIVGNETGLAPGAKWVACVGCDRSVCNEDKIKECGKFMTCPNPPSCSNRPNVVVNIWGFDYPSQSGNTYDGMISDWKNAGIIPVFSVGMGGSGDCDSLRYPADHEDVIAVGGFENVGDVLREDSRKGPPSQRYAYWETKKLIKPEICAPATDILSTFGNNAYQRYSGSVFGAAHVGGAIAILLSRNKNYDFAKVRDILMTSAGKLNTSNPTLECGKLPESTVPNYKFGAGKLLLPSPLNDTLLGSPDPAYTTPEPDTTPNLSDGQNETDACSSYTVRPSVIKITVTVVLLSRSQ